MLHTGPSIKVIKRDKILQYQNESVWLVLYAHVQCMSELNCKAQISASNTIGGVAETRTVLLSVTDVYTDKGLYAPPHFVAGAKERDLG